MSEKRRVVLGISGASGAAIGIRIAELLAAEPEIETHLVVTEAAERTLAHEIGADALARLGSLVACHHRVSNVGASIASGTFKTTGMIIAPCSMHTAASIAAGLSGDLLVRAAHVHLKERRRLVLMVRESPLHLGHLRSLVAVTEYGAIVAPTVPAFYFKPATVDEVIDQIARRAMGLLGFEETAPAGSWSGLP